MHAYMQRNSIARIIVIGLVINGSCGLAQIGHTLGFRERFGTLKRFPGGANVTGPVRASMGVRKCHEWRAHDSECDKPSFENRLLWTLSSLNTGKHTAMPALWEAHWSE